MNSVFFPSVAERGIYYGEIMIYVNGRKDVRLSKGWRYEPIMINVPHSHAHPAPSTLLSDQRRSPTALLCIRPLFIPPLCDSPQHSHHHTLIQSCSPTLPHALFLFFSPLFVFFLLSDIVPSSSLLCCPSVVVYSM